MAHAKYFGHVYVFPDADYRDAFTAARPAAVSITPMQADAYISRHALERRRWQGDENDHGIVCVWE